MIMIGGNAIVARTMTLGDLVMYLFFTGMVAAPMMQMASIGTQITEAFAGLDRIREIKQTWPRTPRTVGRRRSRPCAAR